MASVPFDKREVDKEALLNRVWQDFEFSKAQRDTHVADWDYARKQFECEWAVLTKLQDDENMDQWFYVPKTLMTIHWIDCAVQTNFFGPDRHQLGRVVPAVADDVGLAAACNTVDKVLRAKVDVELRPHRQVYDAVHTSLLDGQGVLKGRWVRAKGQNGKSKAELMFVPGEHALWDPYAITPDEITFFIHERWISQEDLWQRQSEGVYENVGKVFDHPDNAPDDEFRKSIAGPGNSMRRMYKILEFWGPQHVISADRLDAAHYEGRHHAAADIVCTQYANKHLLRVEGNPYADLYKSPTPFEKLPVWLTAPLPKTNSTYSNSLTKWMRPLQREANLTRNQRRQAVHLELVGKMFYDTSRLLNLKAAEAARFGGYVPVQGDPRAAVHWVQPATSTGNLIHEESMIDSEFDDVSGVTGMHRGTPSPAQTRTATAASITTSRGDIKHEAMVQNITNSGIEPMLKFFASCMIQWMPPDEISRITMQPVAAPLNLTIGTDYAIKVEAALSATSRTSQIQNVQAAIFAYAQMASAAPQVAIPAMMKLTKRLLHLLGEGESTGGMEQMEQQMMLGPGDSAAAQGQGQMPNLTDEMSRAQTGQMRTPQEVAY